MEPRSSPPSPRPHRRSGSWDPFQERAPAPSHLINDNLVLSEHNGALRDLEMKYSHQYRPRSNSVASASVLYQGEDEDDIEDAMLEDSLHGDIQQLQKMHALLEAGVVLLDISEWSVSAIIRRVVHEWERKGLIPAPCVESTIESMIEAEAQCPNAIGKAFDIFFGRVHFLPPGERIAAFARLRNPVNLNSADHVPTRFVYLILESTLAAQDTRFTSALVDLMSDEDFHDGCFITETPASFLEFFRDFVQNLVEEQRELDSAVALAPPEFVPPATQTVSSQPSTPPGSPPPPPPASAPPTPSPGSPLGTPHHSRTSTPVHSPLHTPVHTPPGSPRSERSDHSGKHGPHIVTEFNLVRAHESDDESPLVAVPSSPTLRDTHEEIDAAMHTLEEIQPRVKVPPPPPSYPPPPLEHPGAREFTIDLPASPGDTFINSLSGAAHTGVTFALHPPSPPPPLDETTAKKRRLRRQLSRSPSSSGLDIHKPGKKQARHHHHRLRLGTHAHAHTHRKATDLAIRRTKIPFGGIVMDFRERFLRHYLSDLRDGLCLKSIPSIIFLFFACLTPAIAFGALMSSSTNKQIGVIEMIIASCGCGVAYALLSGQPMIILGGTGPMLVFTNVVYDLAKALDIDFMLFYGWIGIWTMVIIIVLGALEVSVLMKYFTRFTDEIFAALISLIFIYEAIYKLVALFIDGTTPRETALLSVIVAMGTYYISTVLRDLRRSRYFMKILREMIADFNSVLAIGLMTIIDALVLQDVQTPKLDIPSSLRPSIDRSWVLPLHQLPVGYIFLAILPAIVAAILLFVDHNITSRLVNNPRNKLLKGPAYHWDLTLAGVLLGVCSIFGLPWLIAATVRSLNHLISMSDVEEFTDEHGGVHDRVVRCRENRITAFAIHLLVGLSLLLTAVLKYIPMPVLFGLFLFMGVSSLASNQFIDRLKLFVTQPSLFPPSHYVRKLKRKWIHLFTLIQLFLVGCLWALKSSPAAIGFPIGLVLLVPFRNLLAKCFPKGVVDILDAHDEIIETQQDQDEFSVI